MNWLPLRQHAAAKPRRRRRHRTTTLPQPSSRQAAAALPPPIRRPALSLCSSLGKQSSVGRTIALMYTYIGGLLREMRLGFSFLDTFLVNFIGKFCLNSFFYSNRSLLFCKKVVENCLNDVKLS